MTRPVHPFERLVLGDAAVPTAFALSIAISQERHK